MKNMVKTIKNNLLAVIVPIIFYGLVLIISPTSRNLNSAWVLIKQAFAPSVLAWGVLFSFAVGNWDFSVGADVVLAAILGGHIAQDLNLGVAGLIVGAIAVGLLCACGTALVYRVLQIPTLIASIGILLIYESLSSLIFDGKTVILDTNYVIFGKFPMNVLAFAFAFFIAYMIYYKLPIGYKIRAVGQNVKVATANGINPIRAKIITMLIVGLFAGIYAAINTGSSGQAVSASNMSSMSICFSSMMCVFIGNSIAGKGNRIFAVFCGSLVVQIINVMMQAIDVSSRIQKVVIAVVVILLMVWSSRPESVQKQKKYFAK